MIMQKTINRPWLRVLCVCMVLCMLVGMLPATVSAATPSKLYLMPNTNWTKDGARFAAYFFGNGYTWVSGVKLSNGMYEFAVPSGYPNVIFCRMNGSAAANDWNNKWNQTGDLKVPTNGNNLYTVPSGSWDGGTAQWGKFDPCGSLGHQFTNHICNNCGIHECDAKGHKFTNNICSVCGAKECDVNGHKFENDICGICGHARYMNIYFRNDWFWSNVTVHFWGTDTDIGTAFPGAAMTLYDNDGTYDYYVLKVPTDIDGLLFVGNKNDAPNVQDQSPDVNSGWYDGIVYYMHWDGGNKVSSFDICDVVFPCKHPNQKPVSGHEATCTQTGLTDGIVCADCGETIKAQDEIPAKGHNWNDATCTVAKTCSVCGETEGEALGHSEPVYTNNGAAHMVDYPCCDDEDNEWEAHSFTDGECVCGAPETVQVTVTNDYGTADTVTLSNTVATPGQDYVTTVTSTVGTSLGVWSVYVAIDDSWYGNYIYEFDAETNTLTVFGDYVAEGIQIEAIPLVTLTTHLNGGTVREDWQYTYQPDANGTLVNETAAGYADGLYGEWDPETDEIILDANLVFEREGYKIIGYNTAADGSGTFYAMDQMVDFVEDTELWLVWECDHKWTDATCTEPKTCSSCGETEGEALGHKDEDNNGRCDECHGLVHPAYLRQVSVSLKGNIALNYYMLLSEEVLADETAYMQFTMADGEVIKLPVSQGVEQNSQGETYYVFTCAVSAKEMTDTVLSQFFYDGGSTREHTYSVQTYAKHILTNYDDAAIKDLITSMLNYGAASQLHFGYNTDKLANADLEAPDYSNVTIDGFKPVAGQGTELAKLYSASLILKSETTLRIFFKVDAAVENLTVTYQGQALEVKQRSGLSYVDVVGISAKALDEVVTVTVNDGANTAEVAFNPMSYSQGVLNDTTGAFGQDMKDLVAALYLYNKAANVYFKEV